MMMPGIGMMVTMVAVMICVMESRDLARMSRSVHSVIDSHVMAAAVTV